MNDTGIAQANITYSNLKELGREPKPDSWVWDVPAFKNFSAEEDSIIKRLRSEFPLATHTDPGSPILIACLLLSILFGTLSCLAFVLLGFGALFCLLMYFVGSSAGFVATVWLFILRTQTVVK